MLQTRTTIIPKKRCGLCLLRITLCYRSFLFEKVKQRWAGLWRVELSYIENAEEEGWDKVKWWLLEHHLHVSWYIGIYQYGCRWWTRCSSPLPIPTEFLLWLAKAQPTYTIQYTVYVRISCKSPIWEWESVHGHVMDEASSIFSLFLMKPDQGGVK
jgi:hypothetical protein